MQVVRKYVWLGVTLSRNAITRGPAFATVTTVLVHYNGNRAVQNDRRRDPTLERLIL